MTAGLSGGLLLCVAAGVWLLAHGMLLIVLYNRLHALGWRRLWIKLLDGALAVVSVALPTLAWRCWQIPELRPLLIAHVGLSAVVIALLASAWWQRRRRHPPAALVAEQQRLYEVARELAQPLAGTWRGRWLQRVPGNEQWCLDFSSKTLRLGALPPSLHGLTIAHLSDWHFTGHVAVEYFEYLVDLVNERRPDLVVITGDIIDRGDCIDWLPRTLGRLRATEGVWFLLGNHDQRLSRPEELRQRLEQLGLVDWGGRLGRTTLRGTSLVVAGNELPWFDWRAVDSNALEPAESPDGSTEFRLLLSHSPDQWRWAVEHRFHLMLAGHTHGGQIVLPVIGPVIAPSRDGVKYAGGLYDIEGLVLHVSRGISGKQPVRWGCWPEVTLITLEHG